MTIPYSDRKSIQKTIKVSGNSEIKTKWVIIYSIRNDVDEGLLEDVVGGWMQTVVFESITVNVWRLTRERTSAHLPS